MENNQSRRYQSAGIPPSPRLLRSKSGNPTTSLPDLHTLTPNSGRKSVDRSKSTTRTRIKREEENRYPFFINRDNNVGISRSQRISDVTNTKRTRSSSGSPSAWALSPGRSPTPSPSPESPNLGKQKLKSSGGVSGVLKYFRQKKVSSIQEESFHRFRVLHNRLLQWRFANARAQAAMAARNIHAEEKLLSAWLRIFQLRNSVGEKRIQVQKLKQDIKLFQIIGLENCLLNKWTKIEKKHSEAVAKLGRKLSSISVGLPLNEGAKADMKSVYKVVCTAMGVMNSIEATITRFFFQVQKAGSLLKDLINIIKQQKEGLEELSKTITMVASLEAQEKCLRIHLIQAAKARVI